MKISVDVQEVVVHQRHVCNDMLYKSMFTLLYLLTTKISSQMAESNFYNKNVTFLDILSLFNQSQSVEYSYVVQSCYQSRCCISRLIIK